MLLSALNYTNLTSGLFLISASAYVIYKVYKGSKSQFAYVILTFTFLDGALNFAEFFISLNMHPIHVGDQTLYVANIYAKETV